MIILNIFSIVYYGIAFNYFRTDLVFKLNILDMLN